MKMWRPETQVYGPDRATLADIEALNAVFADAFTDRYRRDGLVAVRVPYLNPLIWQYALEDAGDGSMLWRDDSGEIIAFNIAHRSGAEGWMGPLAVRPDRQGEGVGKVVVNAATEWLIANRVRTVGLETMPRTVENIGFYSVLGFAPRHLTITLTKDVHRRRAREHALLSARSALERRDIIEACRSILTSYAEGYDFTREIELTRELKAGDTTYVEGINGVEGFALWHSVPLAQGRAKDELRVLKLFAETDEAFARLVASVESAAARLGMYRVAFRCQTRFERAYRTLVARGYRVRWTDLRMSYEGYPEPAVAGATVFSNWEV